jgi:hypothetical protein
MTKRELEEKVADIIREAGGGFGTGIGDAFVEESSIDGELIFYTGLKRKQKTKQSDLEKIKSARP